MKKLLTSMIVCSTLLLSLTDVLSQTTATNNHTNNKNNIKPSPMKEYVLLLRINPDQLKPEEFKEIGTRWAAIIPRWTKQGNFADSKVITQEGFRIGGDKKEEKGVFEEGGDRVTALIIIHAHDMDEAIKLAKECPNLDYRGSVEVREVQPKSVAGNKQ